MKRVSFFLVLIVLLAGVPSPASGSLLKADPSTPGAVVFVAEDPSDPWPGSPYAMQDFGQARVELASSLDGIMEVEKGELCAYVLPAQVFDAMSWTAIGELVGRDVSVVRFEPGNPQLTGVVSSSARGVGETGMLDEQGEWKPLGELVRLVGCAGEPETPIQGNGDP